MKIATDVIFGGEPLSSTVIVTGSRLAGPERNVALGLKETSPVSRSIEKNLALGPINPKTRVELRPASGSVAATWNMNELLFVGRETSVTLKKLLCWSGRRMSGKLSLSSVTVISTIDWLIIRGELES